jgi:hypothetical protein
MRSRKRVPENSYRSLIEGTDSSYHLVFSHESKADLLWQPFKRRFDYSITGDRLFIYQIWLFQLKVSINWSLHFAMRKLAALSKPCLCVNPLVETVLILTLSSEVGQSYAIISTTYVMSSTIKTSTWKVLMSYIALVPTKNNPVLVNDFRHISLLNSLTKILVDRLQAVKLKLIHHNQYIFLRGQTIQDCLIWVFEYLHWCHQLKKEFVIVKLDIWKGIWHDRTSNHHWYA